MTHATATLAIEVAGLRKVYPSRTGDLTILQELDLRIAPGESVAVMGPSGSGKSTLLNILGALDVPSAGRVVVGGHQLLSMTERQAATFRSRAVGFIFQDHQLLPQCTALENVLLPTLAGARDRAAAGRAVQLLQRVGLAERINHFPAELSGGERQRVAIARALINQPQVLLGDEPTGNLDEAAGALVADYLLELQREEGLTLLLVTHNPVFATRFDRILELKNGRLHDRKDG